MRYRPRKPWWQRKWDQLSVEHQQQIRSFTYSLSVNGSVLLILGLCSMAIPGSDAITFSLAMGDAGVEEDVITIAPEPQVEPDQQEETPEPLAPDPDPIIADPELQDLEAEPVASTGDIAASLQASGSNSPTGLSSDDARVTETIRRVAAAGGATNVPVRVSLSFAGDEDIDLHVKFRGKHNQRHYNGSANGYIWYHHPTSRWGRLDVDANARFVSRQPCENVAFRFPPHRATYRVQLKHFQSRGRPNPTPYVVVIKYGNETKAFEGTIRPGQRLTICQFDYRHRNNYQIGRGSLPGRSFHK